MTVRQILLAHGWPGLTVCQAVELLVAHGLRPSSLSPDDLAVYDAVAAEQIARRVSRRQPAVMSKRRG